jgi:hypothetical protein
MKTFAATKTDKTFGTYTLATYVEHMQYLDQNACIMFGTADPCLFMLHTSVH